MTGLIIAILTLVLALFEKQHLFERPIKAEKVIILLIILVAGVFSGIKEYQSDKDQSKASSTIDSLNGASRAQLQLIEKLHGEVGTFRAEAKLAQLTYEDSIRVYHKDSKIEIKQMAYKMTKVFAENSKSNAAEHRTTQVKLDKLDTSKFMPAYLDGLAEPHNVFQIDRKGDFVNVKFVIKNHGDLPAYDENSLMSILFKQGIKFYKLQLQSASPENLIGHANRMMYIDHIKMDSTFYSNIDAVFCCIDGSYYIDEKRLYKRTYKVTKKLLKNESESSSYDLAIPFAELLQIASPYPR